VARNGACLTACIIHKPEINKSLFDNYVLTIANLGDCEVGLISQSSNILTGKMLSNAHTTNNINEREYLIKEFPNDPNILSSKNNA